MAGLMIPQIVMSQNDTNRISTDIPDAYLFDLLKYELEEINGLITQLESIAQYPEAAMMIIEATGDPLIRELKKDIINQILESKKKAIQEKEREKEKQKLEATNQVPNDNRQSSPGAVKPIANVTNNENKPDQPVKNNLRIVYVQNKDDGVVVVLRSGDGKRGYHKLTFIGQTFKTADGINYQLIDVLSSPSITKVSIENLDTSTKQQLTVNP